MRKHLIRAICILGVLVVLVSCLPLSAFAVDPVSATVIANSFAQAIAAYGASNGVAMTFDVANTDGIGETVHELWSDFRAGTQDADDYDTLAAALFPDLYYRALTAAGTAAEAYTVGVRITSEYAEEFDNFYNWLLTGPAEMVQVDNQYYQFSQAQIGSAASPILVGSSDSSPWAGQPGPYISSGSSDAVKYSNGIRVYRLATGSTYALSSPDSSKPVYLFIYNAGSNWYPVFCSPVYNAPYSCVGLSTSGTYWPNSGNVTASSNGIYYSNPYGYAPFTSYVPVYTSISAGTAALAAHLADPSASVSSVGVKAYTPAGIADIPDTADPNYDALGRAKDIPLDVPWDDSLYGDGTGALSDAQSGAIADEIAGVLETDSVIPLVEEEEAVNPRPDPDDDPSGDPDDYAVLGLEDVFPFCIPFDIYAFLSALAADPVPPSFTCTFDFPEALGGTQTLELDFDTPTFNQLAQLLRLLELLAFIVGLALLTRSMFIRG